MTSPSIKARPKSPARPLFTQALAQGLSGESTLYQRVRFLRMLQCMSIPPCIQTTQTCPLTGLEVRSPKNHGVAGLRSFQRPERRDCFLAFLASRGAQSPVLGPLQPSSKLAAAPPHLCSVPTVSSSDLSLLPPLLLRDPCGCREPIWVTQDNFPSQDP